MLRPFPSAMGRIASIRSRPCSTHPAGQAGLTQPRHGSPYRLARVARVVRVVEKQEVEPVEPASLEAPLRGQAQVVGVAGFRAQTRIGEAGKAAGSVTLALVEVVAH